MIEVELPDGTIVEFPAGTDEGTIKRVLGGLTKADPQQAMRDRIAAAKAGTLQASPDSLARAGAADQVAQDQIALSDRSPIYNALTKVAQGIPFVGEFTDELTGAINPAAGERQRAVQGAMDRQFPMTSAALQTAGGVIGSAPLVVAAGPAVVANAPASLAMRTAAGAGAGALAGGVEGAVSGYGAGQGDNRMSSAVDRGLMGAGLGGIIGGAAPLASTGIKNAVEWFKGRDVKVIAGQFGISKDAAKVVKAAIENDDLSAAQNALRRAGSNAMLADASPGASQILDTAMQSGGAANRIGREAVESRAIQANDSLTRSLDTILGPVQGVRGATSEIASRTAPLRAQAYERAYNTAIDYAGDQGRAIEAALDRIPTRTIQSAISEANDAMRAAGVTNKQIMAEIADDGAVVFREMPNVQQLDELKKALQSIGRNETDPVTGKITSAGMRANNLARDLSAALADAVPQYRTAVRLGGDKIAEQNALEAGRKLLLSGTTRESVAEIMDGASVEAKQAAARGLRGYIDDTLANVQAAMTNFDPDNPTAAQEAVKLVKQMSSRANREKVELVLGQAKANALFRQLDEAGTQLATRAAVARNSATYSREASRKMIDEITSPGALGSLMSGEPGQAMRQIVQVFTGQGGEAVTARKQALYGEIAQALTGMRGQQAQDALRIVERAIAGQPVSSAEAARIARTLTTGGALAAYQSGTQLQRTSQYGSGPR
jgi:hypothetical protein